MKAFRYDGSEWQPISMLATFTCGHAHEIYYWESGTYEHSTRGGWRSLWRRRTRRLTESAICETCDVTRGITELLGPDGFPELHFELTP